MRQSKSANDGRDQELGPFCECGPGIAREFGARVFDFVWVDDFAAARNAALLRATGDYALWLDADDVVDPPEREKLRELLAGLGRRGRGGANGDRAAGQAAYVLKCSCDPDWNGNGGQTVVDHVRLFPVRADVRWSFRVHEQILPGLRRARVPVDWTDITIRHTGYTDPALRARRAVQCKLKNAKCKVQSGTSQPPCALAEFTNGLSFAPDHAEQQVCSFDQGIYGHLTLGNLAALAAERGDKAEAERLWRAVLAECPGNAEALAKLAGHAPGPSS
jgi:hypothetical protein